MLKNYYQILGIETNANLSEIKKAYRTHSMKIHPDKHSGDKYFEDKFKELQEAYEVLKDPIKKREYDSEFLKTNEQLFTENENSKKESERNQPKKSKNKSYTTKSRTTKTTSNSKESPFQNLNQSFSKKISPIFWILFGLLVLMSLLFFDPKVSIGGDDSEYLNRAFSFITKGKYPTFQGSLYPIVMGILIGITGLNLVVIKLFSLVFMLIHFWLFYKTFQKHLPAVVLVPILFILAINASMLYFASSAFTEAFFLMIQSLFLFVFEKYFISGKQEKYSIKDYKKFLILGFTLFLMVITKNIGLTAVIGTGLFFAIRLNWMALVLVLLSFGIFQGSLFIIKKTVFEVKEAQVSGQGSTLKMKHPYDASQGQEDLSGYIDRVVVNSKEYLSKHFTLIYGLNSEAKPTPSSFFTLLIYAVLFTGFIMAFKKSDLWTFLGVYLIASCGISFIVLQTYWSQERLILVFTPLILLFLIYTIYQIISQYKPGARWVYGFIIILFLGANIIRTSKKIPDAVESLSHYLKGDVLYGFTPDWIHYFEMSKWVKENLPEDSYVGCRKPGMAFIYSGGKEFYGIWKVPSEDPDELYNKLKDAGVTHVMLASLRAVPSQKTNRTISTVRNYLSIIHNAYPDKLKFIHKVGDDEPVFLYELK